MSIETGYTIIAKESSKRPWSTFATVDVHDALYNRAYLRMLRFAMLLNDPIYRVIRWELDMGRPRGNEYREIDSCYLGGRPLPDTEEKILKAFQGDFGQPVQTPDPSDIPLMKFPQE